MSDPTGGDTAKPSALSPPAHRQPSHEIDNRRNRQNDLRRALLNQQLPRTQQCVAKRAVQNDLQLEALFEASEKVQNEVTGQLGLQVRQAVELLVAALSRTDFERGGALLAGVAPQTVYEAAATVMMRLVFLLYAEERDLLPMADPLYADCYAASTLREQLDDQAAMEGDEPRATRGRMVSALSTLPGYL